MDEDIDLDLALRTLHALALEDGDLGYAYWTSIATLLKDASAMRERIRELELEVVRLTAKRAGSRGQGKPS